METANRPSTLHNFFVNVIYHMAWNATLNNLDASKQCREWLTNMLPAWQGANWKAVQDSWSSGEDDSFVSAELNSMLGHDLYGYISQFIHAQVEKK